MYSSLELCGAFVPLLIIQDCFVRFVLSVRNVLFLIISHIVLITTGRYPNETRSPRSILPKWIPNSIKVLGSYLGSDKANILISGDRYLEEHFQQYSYGSCAPLLTATDNASILAARLGLGEMVKGKANEAMKFFDFADNGYSEHLLIDLALSRITSSQNLEDVVNSLGKEKFNDSRDKGEAWRLPSSSFASITLDFIKKQEHGRVKVDDSGECARINDNDYKSWMRPLAPSLQHRNCFKRARATIVPVLSRISEQENRLANQIWENATLDTNHIWYALTVFKH